MTGERGHTADPAILPKMHALILATYEVEPLADSAESLASEAVVNTRVRP